MEKRRVDISIEDGRYDGKPTGKDAYYAMFATREHDVIGCPLGRGATKEAALKDLAYRTNFESVLKLTVEDFQVDRIFDTRVK